MFQAFVRSCLLAAGILFSFSASAAQTYYYTMWRSKTLDARECKMEGNQILDGKLYGSGSDCRRGIPFTARYCPWGVGNRNNCLVPCVHAAGPKAVQGQRLRVAPFTCPWGPLKGQTIRSVVIADTGPSHIDVFVGICVRKKRDVCVEFAPSDARARKETARALTRRQGPATTLAPERPPEQPSSRLNQYQPLQRQTESDSLSER